MVPAFVIRITNRRLLCLSLLFICFLVFSYFLVSQNVPYSYLFSLLLPWNQSLLLGALVPFTGEAFLDVKKNTMVFPHTTHDTLKALYSGPPNVWSFLPPPQPPHQGILQHQLGIVQYNVMLTLSTQRQHQILWVNGSVLRDYLHLLKKFSLESFFTWDPFKYLKIPTSSSPVSIVPVFSLLGNGFQTLHNSGILFKKCDILVKIPL